MNIKGKKVIIAIIIYYDALFVCEHRAARRRESRLFIDRL